MNKLRVVCLTSDGYLWAVRPFSYLMSVYWSTQQPIIVGGFSRPQFPLPPNIEFVQLDTKNYPASKWSDSLIILLNSIEDKHIVFMLEDYWLSRTADVRGIDACHKYIENRDAVLRIDLTDDRQYSGGVMNVDAWGSYDIVETPHKTPYQMSTQAGLWNRSLLLSILERGKSGWETEIHTQPPETMRVLGTRQCPVRYANAMLKGKLLIKEVEKIQQPHRDKVMSFIPKNILEEAE